MLSYKPPFLEVGNLTIFRDDANPNAFYYLCSQPSVCVNEHGEPMISAYAMFPESGVGTTNEGITEASLMIDICLRPQQEALEAAEKAIQQTYGRKPVVFTPAPLHSGKVYFVMAQAGEEPDSRKWFITSEIKPSLFGDNRASLVVKTSGTDARQLIAALNSDVVPAAVYYDLEIIGIAPVFKASLVAHWEKLYHHFEKHKKNNYIFYKSEISNIIDELTETKEIEVYIEESDPDIKAEAMKSLLNELKTEVIKQLFNPAPLASASSEGGVAAQIGDAVKGIISTVIPGTGYTRKDIKETRLGTTTINLSQRNAKKYPFYPQSLLFSLISSIGGIRESIKWIKLEELPWIDQRVDIRLSADTFTSSNIRSVHIDCRVFDEDTGMIVATPKSISFDSDNFLQHHFNFTRQKNVKYRYDYKVVMYMTTSSNKLPNKMELDWISIDTPYIYINPAEYFKTYEIDINLDDFSIFNQTHLIQADVEVKDISGDDPVMTRSYMFNKEDKEHKILSIVANKYTPLAFNLKLTYFITESKEHIVLFNGVKEGFFFIPNPFENRWNIDLICNADWEKTNKIILETRVWDVERIDPVFNKFTFSPVVKEQRLEIACSLDTPKEVIDYRVTVLTGEDDIVQGPWLTHEGPILVINEKIKPERIIRASIVDAPDFEKKEIKKVTVEFLYEDAHNHIEHRDKAEIYHSDGKIMFRHPMPDSTKKEYRYKLNIQGMNREVFKSKNWICNTNERLEIIIPDDIW